MTLMKYIDLHHARQPCQVHGELIIIIIIIIIIITIICSCHLFFLHDNRYQDLALELKRVHGATKVAVIPIVIGALGTISKKAKLWYGRLSLPDIFGSVQLSAILGTAHILQKVLRL